MVENYVVGDCLEEKADEKSKYVRDMFSAIVPTYDLVNHVLSVGIDVAWRRMMVRSLPEGDINLLDLACGTGDVTIEALKVRPKAMVFGTDFTHSMLLGAKPKIKKRGLGKSVILQTASAEDLPYKENVFDAMTIAFGIRNVARRQKALKEICRVMQPDGKALILDFSLPPNFALRFFYRIYFLKVLPLIAGLISGNFEAYKYLPKSVEGFPPPEKFAQELRDAGFKQVEYKSLTFGIATFYQAIKE